MAIPILLVAGFLGAGKTTLLNALLRDPDGRRIAAVVNDFGALDIDAALLGSAGHDVLSLRNGCICCTLGADLLGTLSMLLRRVTPPDAIAIETSGVSDPAGIVRILLDPVIQREAVLETVLCLVDARQLADDPSLGRDPLFRAQVAASDFVALTKIDLVTAGGRSEVEALLGRLRPGLGLHEARHGALPCELLFSGQVHGPLGDGTSRFRTPGFSSLSWTAERPLSLPRFQAAMSRLAGRLVRAKGFLLFTEHADTPMLFQMVGRRASFVPAHAPDVREPVRLVFIFRDGALMADEVISLLDDALQKEVRKTSAPLRSFR